MCAGLVIVPNLCAERADPVAVLANADGDYVKQKFPASGGKIKAESYLFAQGRYFGGELRDGSLEHTQFMDIARTLAPALAKQAYYPTVDKKDADLLIVVHWGTSNVDEQDQWLEQKLTSDALGDNTGAKAGNGSSGVSKANARENANMDADMLGSEQDLATNSVRANEQLLGFTSAVSKAEYQSVAVASGMTQEDHDLRELLLEERYFVILMAYDFHGIKNHKKPKLLWSTHFNMRSPGHNFTTALPLMSNVAANYFGHNVDQLILDAKKVPQGIVIIGEPKTVEEGRQN